MSTATTMRRRIRRAPLQELGWHAAERVGSSLRHADRGPWHLEELGVDWLAPSGSVAWPWTTLGSMVVTSVLVPSFGRLGDMHCRIGKCNPGSASCAFSSLFLTDAPKERPDG